MTLSEERIAEIANYIADGYPHPCNPIEHMELCRLALIGKATEGAVVCVVTLSGAVLPAHDVYDDEYRRASKAIDSMQGQRVRIVPCTEGEG